MSGTKRADKKPRTADPPCARRGRFIDVCTYRGRSLSRRWKPGGLLSSPPLLLELICWTVHGRAEAKTRLGPRRGRGKSSAN